MARFYYEDSEQPWRPDGILQEYIRDRPQRHRDTEQVERALDLGMGYGRNSLWLAEQGYKVEGWERDRRYVAEAKREWRRRVCNVQPSGFAQGRRAAGLGKGKTKLETRNSKLERSTWHSGSLHIRRGDFTRGGWRGPYDVIVISQALHQVKRSEALRVLRKAATRLRAPRYGGQAGGRLFLLVKLTSDRHFQRVRRDPAWKAVRGERNTYLRPAARKRGHYHAGRPRTPQMYLSALEPGEVRQALKGLRTVHWRRMVLRSDWEEEQPVTHTVAEVVAERRK